MDTRYTVDYEKFLDTNPNVPSECRPCLEPAIDQAEEDFSSFIIGYLFM